MNPYHKYVSDISDLVRGAKALPLGGFGPLPRPEWAPGAPTALFFAPHPDDECIVGGAALRIQREAGMRLVNVAVTQGSKKERQAERLAELRAACRYIGFDLATTGSNGLERVNPTTRLQDPAHWATCVDVLRDILEKHQPRVILFPHEHDWNSTHIGTHFLVTDALRKLSGFECFTIETEFWGQMANPNLMVEISEADLTDLITATTFHAGEVTRNPYHLSLPAWMMDNVRRGGELVGGQGGAAPEFTFAALYRLRRWAGRSFVQLFEGGRMVPKEESIGELFA